MLFFFLLAFLFFIVILIIKKRKKNSTDFSDDVSCIPECAENVHALSNTAKSVSTSIETATYTYNETSGKNWNDITQEEIDSVKCHGDNMNKQNYKIRAKYIPTNHFRTFTAIAFDESEAIATLSEDCDKSTASISIIEFPPPTERQIQYALSLGIEIPPKCCQYDLSTLIDNREGLPAPSALFEFAQSRGLFFSYYADEPFLIRLIASSLSVQEWVAFAIICLRKELIHAWDFSKWENCLSYSSEVINNPSFINSLKRSHLRDNFLGFKYSSYLRDTIFYKTLYNFCSTLGGISNEI